MSTTIMTHRAQAALKFIIAYKKEHDGNSPTIREIGSAISVDSTSLVDYYLTALEQNGYIRRVGHGDDGRSRSIEVVGGSWRCNARI